MRRPSGNTWATFVSNLQSTLHERSLDRWMNRGQMAGEATSGDSGEAVGREELPPTTELSYTEDASVVDATAVAMHCLDVAPLSVCQLH
jgi:hypothetical protein